MTNKEKFRNEIEDIVFSGKNFGVSNNIPMQCTSCCGSCIFRDTLTCDEQRLLWLKEEYIEKKMEVDWTKVPVDTPVFVKNVEDGTYYAKHFAEYKCGCLYTWLNGKTSFTEELKESWNYAILAEPHPEWMKEVEYND